MKFMKQQQPAEHEQQANQELTPKQKAQRWGCAEPGCPMPGGVSSDRGGDGAKYYCRYHINARGTDESPVITTRIRTLLRERSIRPKVLCESLHGDNVTDKWIRTGSYPSMEPNLSTRLHEQHDEETETEAA